MPIQPKQQPPYYDNTTTNTIKKYLALLRQESTNAPIIQQLQNTLGQTVTWTRQALGYYKGTSTGAFPENKTIAKPFGGTYSTAFNMMGIANGTPQEISYTITIQSPDSITLEIYNTTTYASVELSSIQTSQQWLLIDIEIHP